MDYRRSGHPKGRDRSLGTEQKSDDRTHPGRPLIFISAAEPSADIHGAALIRATILRCPTARFVGVAGPRMVAAGCDSIFDMTPHSAMLLGIFGVLGRGVTLLRTSDEHLRRYPFDAAVVIDSPMLHLRLAAKAHALGIPTLYYIAPQLWAWGTNRIYRLRHNVDRVAVILPFEEEFFRDQGVDATYVGHPLAERIAKCTIDPITVNEIRARGGPVVALLPGSRRHVVEAILPGQLEVAEGIARQFPNAAFGVSVAGRNVAAFVNEQVHRSAAQVRAHSDHLPELIQAADLVLVASGTTALEVAFHERPMIVMYNASRLFYHLVGRWLIQTPYLSLPNILAGREIVPEFMPYYTSTTPIIETAIDLLRSTDRRRKMLDDLAGVVEPLRGARASDRVASMLLEMIEPKRERSARSFEAERQGD